MQSRTPRMIQLAAILLILVALAVAAYALTGRDDEKKSPDAKASTHVTLFMSYIPSVQFAPVYVALERGYFAEEGINLQLENSFNEADGVARLGSNDLQFGLISGEQIILGRSQGLPLVYVFEWYHNFPVGIVSPQDLNLTEPADLEGRVVGIPGPFGASYMGFRALLSAAGMTEDDLQEIRSIGFTAPDNVCEQAVEAAVIYIANEPLTIEQDCFPVNVIKVSDYITLVSNGLVTNEEMIRENPDLVRGMVRAIQRGLADTLADPDAAFKLTVPEYVPELSEDQYDTQRQVLQNSLELWRSDDLGRTTPSRWETTQTALIDSGLMAEPLADLSACYNMDFLP
ncbi:MAG TPA: ABC transporter substrate-binding protein [Aggregatilineaceae bacterium]|nr:ABC transporter substrate-binding protein [Aggregatilineaceae bacterium]